jgi:hypothetical protein
MPGDGHLLFLALGHANVYHGDLPALPAALATIGIAYPDPEGVAQRVAGCRNS